jgi:hypothetical protein
MEFGCQAKAIVDRLRDRREQIHRLDSPRLTDQASDSS